MKIGVPRAWFTDALDPEVAAAIENVVEEYRRQGAQIVDIALPLLNSAYRFTTSSPARKQVPTCRVLTVCVTGTVPPTTAIFRT